MEPLGRAAGVLCATFVIAGAIWVGRYSPWAVLSEARVKPEAEKAWEEEKKVLQAYADDLKARQKREEMRRHEDPRPKISNRPPFPKAVIETNVFDFGEAQVGETLRHKFKITNVGQVPLILYAPPSAATIMRADSDVPKSPRK
jgi:hypothetical protein